MRRLALLIAAGSLWLFLAAVPALADGGPHVSSVNSGTSSLTADSCAGCHRAHAAQGEYLLNAASEEALCLGCHGTGGVGTGATTNVEGGLQYVPTGAGDRSGTVLGALRNGGFENAWIDAANPSRMTYIRGWEDGPYNTEYAISTRPKVPVASSGSAVTSAHIDLDGGAADGIADTGRVWGSGATGLGAGGGLAPVTLTCVECHNPHGNGQYRILRPVPGIEADPLGSAVAIGVNATYTEADTIVTETQHKLVVNDVVDIAGVAGVPDSTYYVQAVVNGFTFKIANSAGASSALNISTGGAGGTVTRPRVAVADSSTDPDGIAGNGVENPTKNYTVLQVKGVQGVDSTFLLYARDVVSARTALDGGVDEDAAPVTVTAVVLSSSGVPQLQTGALASGVAPGDIVTIAGLAAQGVANGDYTVNGVTNTAGATVYNMFTLVGINTGTAGAGLSGSVIRLGITGDYSATGGDYFRRTVPWNASLQNSNCNPAMPIVSSSTNPAYAAYVLNNGYCQTMNDAPNGQPAAVSNGSTLVAPTSIVGEQAFVDQMSTWCATCHSRYYQNSNQNPNDAMEASSTLDSPILLFASSNGRITAETLPATGARFSLPSYGDTVTFSGTGNVLFDGLTFYVTNTGTSSGVPWITVSATRGGAPVAPVADSGAGNIVRTVQSSASGWWFPRSVDGVEDPTYKYQHSTASNRACTVCHVGHGSNASMLGENGTTFSLDMAYPDGAGASTSSRLLKVDNRGTCQLCHDPTGTVPEGTLLGGNTSIP